ncbi:MAG: alkaline phosphatase family protein [Burkholderiales bacterium]|nr:alkaline phosphatase family protein [Burkholderiales bacterium]MDE2274853.1 alkaline phosphatase family protein [Burkholderiales bacterium]
MVWDGLRPDSVNATDTPNLYALRQSGVNFSDNHSTYPTFTMMNGSSFATGSFPKTSGFYGNTFWTPPQGSGNTIPAGPTAGGGTQDYVAPVFTEDYQVLNTLNDYYGGQLLLVKSLFATAQAAGLVTATVGKSGAAYIQDLGKGGYFIDENTVQPRSLVTELQTAGIALPVNVVKGYSGADAVTLAANNGNPTNRAGYVTFNTTAYDPSGVLTVASRDSTDTTQGAPETASNRYLMSVFTQYILPVKKPMLSLIWFRTPDNVEHGYGPGSANAVAGLRSQDARLGELIAGLRANGMDSSTNIIVVSDHGHSSVSGPLALYPLRSITSAGTLPNGPLVNGSTSGSTNSVVGPVAASGGYSFSGDVRSADLLTYRGFKAYDGSGCTTSAMYGLDASGKPTVPLQSDTTGALCGKAGTPFQAISASLSTPVASFKVPAPGSLPANGIVVAANGGSDYFYVPSHDAATIAALVKVLQQREEYGAIFVDSRYGALPGTLSMAQVNLENATRQGNGQPDVVASFNWDYATSVQGLPGIEFESAGGQRGMHGSFGISDVHNTLIANGPSFKAATVLSTPTGNVDVAPTAAYVLGLSMPQADGRVVNEALAQPASTATPTVTASTVTPAAPATGLRFELPTDPTGATADTALGTGSYTVNLAVKDLVVDGKTYRYFDYATAVRR